MSPRALANQERQLQTQRVTKLGRSALLLVATVLSFSTIGLLMADQLYRPEAFVIDQLKIKGQFHYLQPSDIEQVVKQESLGNFFSIDLSDIKQRVESVPWVQNADIRREWPNTLLINTREHRPVMLFNDTERNNDDTNPLTKHWLTSQGRVVELPGSINLDSPIVLFGNQRDSQLLLKQTYQWKQLIESHDLKIIEVQLSNSHAWTLRLSYLQNEFDVLLGRVDIEQRLSRFLFLFDGEFRQADQLLTRVDARYPNGLAIKSQKIKTDEQLALVKFENSMLTTEQHNR